MEKSCFDIAEYGCDVFNISSMRRYLAKDVFDKLTQTVLNGVALDPDIAGDVAHAMKEWALEQGATHFTHWFQPLTGNTAEKHDSFLELDAKGNVIMAFSSKNLILSEPDASSFPSGGLRCTFEARGYTAWDPTSPAFIKRHSNGATLCIPTAFFSYTGEALDQKTPLLRSLQAIYGATRRLMKQFGLPEARPLVTLGAEQEYFLIDRKFYSKRPDLLQTGRTLFGAPPPKRQQLNDHYFGAIKPRVLAYMSEVERELWKLGIPAKTRHNEAAPAQFELAPIFEEVNLACDHNMLVMEILRQVAERHGFVCLLHEKPFAGVNGSGKHNNWSIDYGDIALLRPGCETLRNEIFLTTLCAVVQAVSRHGDLLRAATAGSGNDHRLGAAEAPPAIISVFLGEQLTQVLDELEKGAVFTGGKSMMRLGVDVLPQLPRDSSDRNRTSPFAFTGNKFEFRAPGSSQSCAWPMLVLNTIVAESFDEIAGKLEKVKANGDFHRELQKILSSIIREHKRVIFNGDNYSESWVVEASKRGLPNLADTPSALKVLTDKKNIALFERYEVLSPAELSSRYEVFLDEYVRRIKIEAELSLNISRSLVEPAAIEEFGEVLRTLNDAKRLEFTHGTAAAQNRGEILGRLLDELSSVNNKMAAALMTGDLERIRSLMPEMRRAVDALERQSSDRLWPLPKYRDMLFVN